MSELNDDKYYLLSHIDIRNLLNGDETVKQFRDRSEPRNRDGLTKEDAKLIHELCCRVSNYNGKDGLPYSLLDLPKLALKIKNKLQLTK